MYTDLHTFNSDLIRSSSRNQWQPSIRSEPFKLKIRQPVRIGDFANTICFDNVLKEAIMRLHVLRFRSTNRHMSKLMLYFKE